MRPLFAALIITLIVLTTVPPAVAQPGAITIYSGRTRELVAPLFDRFTQATGIPVRVRYGETAELAATVMEEGPNSPADVYLAQDAGALGALTYAGRLRRLPDALLRRVDSRFRSSEGTWVGISGRARVVAYNTRRVQPQELPESIWGFGDARWRGRIGWAPTNGSFQAHVTAMRLFWGSERAKRWLLAVKANHPRAYRSNPAIVAALGAGEIDVGFVNHYYLFRFLEERGPQFPVRNHFFKARDAGNLVNVAGAAIVDTSANTAAAVRLLEFMLSPDSQRYFAAETYEYPLLRGVAPHPLLPALSQIPTLAVDLDHLQALEETLRLLREVGVL